MDGNIWGEIDCVYLTSFWGWSPESWSTVGFTLSGRRDTIIRETTDPFIMVIYVTKNAGSQNKIDGKITGFYVVSHVKGHRNEYTDPRHHSQNPDKWQYSLKALRAFSFVPEYRPNIDDFDPTVAARALSIAASGIRLSDDQIKLLRRIPYFEVPVYGGDFTIDSAIKVPDQRTGMVKAGPQNRSGYVVPGEPEYTEKELYVLLLEGDTSLYLGEAASDRRIFKIGLSLSPALRLEAYNRTLPWGTFKWKMYRSTRRDGHPPYPSFKAAEVGELAMKKSLAGHTKWLGGEFYAAQDAHIDSAWAQGRRVALAFRGSK